MKSGFLEKLIERLGRIGPDDVQNYLIRLAEEKGFFEPVFNAIQEERDKAPTAAHFLHCGFGVPVRRLRQ